jgi:hypothetical protein
VRRKLRMILFLLLLAISLTALLYGVSQGDAVLVRDNAAAFCFT